jgi:hypothetical protein
MWLLDFRKPPTLVQIEDINSLKAELDELRAIIADLRDDMKHLQDLNAETQKTNVLLYPENFDKDKGTGTTVFVKNGEEKPYDTIDWRSR